MGRFSTDEYFIGPNHGSNNGKSDQGYPDVQSNTLNAEERTQAGMLLYYILTSNGRFGIVDSQITWVMKLVRQGILDIHLTKRGHVVTLGKAALEQGILALQGMEEMKALSNIIEE